MLSQAFTAYVADLRQDPGVGITYVDPQLKPQAPSPMTILSEAASAPSLDRYVKTMGWMHPIYGELREAIADHKYADDHERDTLAVNLERARALPATKGKYIVVNAAQQRLYMYDDRKPVDSMVVVVGQQKWPTPMLSAYVRYAALNPYWYVPSDLAWEDVGQWVKKYGHRYFDRMGYEQVSDWSDNPQILDPTKIDWDAVRDGKDKIYLRQKPGPQNFMGRMKFMFPNQFGVYLHDNPRRELFEKQVRYYSGGCVRLEDASAARQMAVRPRPRLAVRGDRAAGDAAATGAGLHHLSDGHARGRWNDRLLQGRIRPRHRAAGDPVGEGLGEGRRHSGRPLSVSDGASSGNR